MKHVRMLATTALLMLTVAALSRLPHTPPGADNAVLRLSWRMSVSGAHCRDRTQQELEALPVHMRAPQVCERDAARYILVTRVGEAAADTVDLARGGVKGDRPLFVLRERVLPPGPQRIQVAVHRLGGLPPSALPTGLDTTLIMVPGRVALITLDADAHRLVVR
jgi:hypothetical protein